MPPKAKPSKKAEIKKQDRVIEDKTFGLKNKKGAKNQKFIQQVHHQVKTGNQSVKKTELAKQADGKKNDKKKEIDELGLFKPVTTQKVEKGTDPKSVLCAFYKQGSCTKGDKCKFSHDLSIERKSEKRNVYVDVRDNDEDLMENWDEEKLKEVVETKHGEIERKLPKTDIICKFFLDALENNKYGWFWECPNGANKCHYRHALPPGFVLKKDKKREDKTEQISLEDLVENQRRNLSAANLTRITYETFLLWKKKKLKEKQAKNQKEEDRKRAEFKAGRHVGLSGRDMFTFNPEMATDDQTEEGETAFEMISTDEDENEQCYEISAESLSMALNDVTGGTVVSVRHWENSQAECAEGVEMDAAPIDENLFDEEDLEDLERELDTLDVQ